MEESNSNFIEELKQRKVVRALVVYAAISWVALQVVDVISEPLELPLWVSRALIIAFVLGLPMVAVLSWIYDVTRYGLVHTSGEGERHKKGISIGALGVLTATILSASILVSYQMALETPEGEGSEVISLAIMPFDVLPTIRESHLARLSEDLNDRLSANPQLRLASDDAVNVLPLTNDLSSKAKQLGVRYILEGTIEKAGETIDLAIRLFDQKEDHEVWQQNFQNAQLAVINPLVMNELLSFFGLSQQPQRPTTNAKAYDLYLQGLRYFGAGPPYDKVEPLFRAAIAEDPRFALPYAGLCRFFIDRFELMSAPSDFQTAEKNCFRALTLDDRSVEVHRSIASLYGASGQYDKARDSYNKVLSMNPEHYGARFGLARSYVIEDSALSERLFMELIHDHPGSPNGYAGLQNLYFQQGRYAEAVEPARWWVRLVPGNEAAKFSLSADLMLAGMFSDAKSLLLDMLDADSNRIGDVHSNLATAYFFEGEYAKAAELYQIAVEREPDNPVFLRNLGDTIWHLDGAVAARPVFEKTMKLSQQQLEINPEDYNSLTTLVVAAGSLGNETQLENYLRKSLEQAEGNPQVHYDAAVVYSRLGNLEHARKYALEAKNLGYPIELLKADPDIRKIGVQWEI